MEINYTQALSIIPRSLVSLVILFIITRIMGKKQASELSLFDYVIGISIGNFTAEQILNFETQYINGIIAIVVFGVCAYTVSYVTMKSIKLRRLLIGYPTVLIQNGNISLEGLKSEKIDVSDLLEQCRNAGYFDISEIEYAILEVNGKVSFLPKADYKPATPKDLSIETQPEELTATIIIDGKMLLHNIEHTNKDLKWFKKELKKKGYEKYEDILLATYKNEEFILYLKDGVKQIKKVLE